MSYIGLLDCNNFFVSCERLFRPDLKDRPVVVLSSNDGCVVARSNEVKEMGIPMGIPYFQVKQDLADGGVTLFSSNFALYRDVSSRVMATLKDISPQVQQYSVDEAFFRADLGDDDALDSLQALKRVIEQRVGIPVSVGVAKTKTIAKYAAEKEKRSSGICILEGNAWQQECEELPIHKIWGIGGKTAEKMRQHEISTVAEFLACDPARIDRLFGIDGLRKREELSERSVYKLGDKTGPQKSIMSTRSFRAVTTEKSVIADALAYHVTHAAEELRSMGQQATHVRILANPSRHSDWALRRGSAEASLVLASNDTRTLVKEAHRLLDSVFEAGVPYKKAGVILSGFTDEEYAQPDLFATATDEADRAVMGVLDHINNRFGKDSITIGRTDQGKSWRTSKEFVSPHYTTNWGEIPIIKAEV